MNTFTIGIIVGFALFGIMVSVAIINKIQVEITRLAKESDNMNKTMQLMFLKINKIEKITHTTMEAAETFVDGLRESAEQIQQQMNRSGPRREQLPPDAFDDLRKSFEDGINDMEERLGDETEDDSDEPQEPWK